MMDELDSGAMALLIDREITAAEQAARQRAARYEAAGLLADAARVWDEFALAVKPLRDQKHALVMAMRDGLSRGPNTVRTPWGETIEEAAAEIERLRAALLSVRSEVNLSKAPKLMAKIEAALGIEQEGDQKVAQKAVLNTDPLSDEELARLADIGRARGWKSK